MWAGQSRATIGAGAATATPVLCLLGASREKATTISIATARLWRAFPALMENPKESTPKFPVYLPSISPGLTNSIILSYKSHQADTWQVWARENRTLMVHMSTGVFLCIPYVSRFPAVGQRSKTQLEPALQCCWRPGKLQSRFVPSSLPAASLRHKASSLAPCPPSGIGLCSSLSAYVQEFHDNCWDR